MNMLKVSMLCSLAVVAALSVSFSQLATAGSPCCEPVCCPAPVVCCPAPPPPVKVTLCVVDPCTGCVYEECVCVPACCAGETPCMTWKKGVLGRKVLTYKWTCCDHCVDVVITGRGKTIVRD